MNEKNSLMLQLLISYFLLTSFLEEIKGDAGPVPNSDDQIKPIIFPDSKLNKPEDDTFKKDYKSVHKSMFKWHDSTQ
uniref:Uncharacterized protein n=1 Tax=Ditylenchus dipsaci TaxID=166011 RepID=A0A915DMZ7_9BILA